MLHISFPPTANGQCVYDKNITHENKTMTIAKNNITYTCVSYEDIRTVACGRECTTNDGAPMCCESSSRTPRNKVFKCTACSDIPVGSEHLKVIDMTHTVLVPSSRCSCYLCPASENSETTTSRTARSLRS